MIPSPAPTHIDAIFLNKFAPLKSPNFHEALLNVSNHPPLDFPSPPRPSMQVLFCFFLKFHYTYINYLPNTENTFPLFVIITPVFSTFSSNLSSKHLLRTCWIQWKSLLFPSASQKPPPLSQQLLPSFLPVILANIYLFIFANIYLVSTISGVAWIQGESLCTPGSVWWTETSASSTCRHSELCKF